MKQDTIAAISTPLGYSGIGIVRMSGEKSFSIAKKIFLPGKKRKMCWERSFKMHYGWIIDPRTKEVVDEVLLSLMKAPSTYTREDIVEINCHGGPVALRRVLDICLSQGARLAKPGEFTLRAFLNGRIDLSQAESVLDIVQAETEKSLKMAVNALRGSLSRTINHLRDKMVELLSCIEAEIDFCEEDIEILSKHRKEKIISDLLRDIKELIEKAKTSQIYREGIKVVILGKVNVGKSSLLNSLLEKERAIVSTIPGTTRDTIEEMINIEGYPCRIIDTAGFCQVKDEVEKESIKRTLLSLKQADIVILMVDGSSPLEKQDFEIFSFVKELKKELIVVINKIDLPLKMDEEILEKNFPSSPPVKISATRGINIEKLKEKIKTLILKKLVPSSDEFMINLRHKNLLEKAHMSLERAQKALKEKLSEEFIAVELREAIGYLDEITGRKLEGEVLERIFSNFCIGK
ncbi:tRNA uridine-5-carboxymethylaminomethyl(34) synthesis GTPase MnmE [Candidatus Aerophobetes bacterium]|nr:tRNA uridine-5-carboxymethylaminomethyl(34) synthesis GTPase MnmE [Candidatus Aerophobetes bacterium]